MEAVAQEGVRPGLHTAFVELPLPGFGTPDRGAEMGAVADGERGDTLWPRQCCGQRHRAADRLADKVEALQSRGISDGEQVVDHLLERPGKIRRRDMRAPVAAHV